MGSNDRFYQLSLSHRPALHGDVGSLLKIEGIVIGGEGERAILMLPDAPTPASPQRMGRMLFLSTEEWSDWLQRSDNPEVLVPNPDGSASLPKIFHRKLRYDISGAVQQKVWAADGFKCMYCGAPFGKTLMTIDHFQSLESGGENNTSNYLSCCKKCNKQKGARDPRDWCALQSPHGGVNTIRNYEYYVQYLKNRKLP